ncbi:MAG: alpha-(1-_3)-arabinofuranosyltransferase family protein [Candidatus Cybelea sp.]
MKQEAARASTAVELRWPDRAMLRRAFVPALFVALALLLTLGYGSGVQLNDGQADLHIDPLKFLFSLLHAWNPSLYLGTHTGFWFPYETPYAWVYGIAQAFHISQLFAQRFVVFAVYTGCLASMYYCLRNVAPWLDETSRIAGSVAYLFNMYVALNSQAQIVWLLTYATVPAMVGITARAMRGEMNAWPAALGIALLVLVGGGVNPPLVAINVILLAIFVVVTLALSPDPGVVARRSIPFIVAACAATLLINLYWVVPFGDYFRSVWLSGVLSEGPSLHNAATSFENVLRGLGHWATFVSFGGRAYFPWAAPYAAGAFGGLLWFVPIVALGGVAFARNQRPITLYFLVVTIVSVPIVVGYYHDALGDAVTTPIYDAFYRYFPGFQMFRFSYKWVAGVEFGISGLYGLASYAVLGWLRDWNAARREPLRWLPAGLGGLLVAMPVIIFIPVLILKMNYPASTIPAWEYRENALLGNDDRHRVALFPTQFLEQFDWGNPQFYIENSLIRRPMIYGLLGSEPSQGTDLWVRRAYRATREGLPFAADMFRVLGVDTFLQRDDFIPVIDFSSPDESRFNTTTLTHDLLHRVLGAVPERSDGPLHAYRLPGALPLIYGVTHPVIGTDPTFSDGYLGNVEAMARGEARFDPQARSTDEFSSGMLSLSPILPESAEQVRDLAVNQALIHGVRIHPSSVAADWSIPFEIKSGGVYDVFARDQSLLFALDPPQTLSVDSRNFTPQSGGDWSQFGTVTLSAGRHAVSDGYVDQDLDVALVRADDLKDWQARIAALVRALPQNTSLAKSVYGFKTIVTLPSAGRYRVQASAVGPFGPDGLAATHLEKRASSHGAFAENLSPTLPYISDAGVAGTSAILMPASWYRDDPAVYAWQRGDPESWFLFARAAHVRVFVPGTRNVVARAAMKISRLQVGSVLNLAVNGRAQRTLTLAGGNAGAQEYDSTDQLTGPAPVGVTADLTLGPGWNDVAFLFESANGERGDLGAGVISAAVAPDLSFTQIGSAPGASPVRRDGSFSAQAVAGPPGGLEGDPDLVGNISSTGSGNSWLAVAIGVRGSVTYRLLPLPQQGNFDINFMHAFPNNWYDGYQRVVGIWFVSRTARAKLTGLYYDLHAMPARALHRPQSLTSLPIAVDGKIVTQPVFLSRGTHVVKSADREVKIGLLSMEPVTLPKTRPFALDWQRRSPTSVDVTVPAKASAAPFLLVFGDAYHPEWQATLNGNVLNHVIVNGVSNG